MLKMALLDCSINEKLVKVLMEDRALTLFFRSHPGGLDSSSRVTATGSLPSKAKKYFSGVSPGWGAGRSWN